MQIFRIFAGKADDTDDQIHNQIHLRIVYASLRRGKEYGMQPRKIARLFGRAAWNFISAWIKTFRQSALFCKM